MDQAQGTAKEVIHWRHFIHTVPSFTLGYKVIEHNNGLMIFGAVAYCSRKDQYNRKLGRRIVEGRLTKHCGGACFHHFVKQALPTNYVEWRELENAILGIIPKPSEV